MTATLKTRVIVVMAGAVVATAALLTHGAPGMHAAAPGELSVQARMASSHTLRGVSDAYLAVTVSAPDHRDTANRPPVSLSIVIDRSGSMSGEKLDHAKLAARELVNRLGPQDRVAVVAYGSTVDVPFPSAPATADNRYAASAAIDAIRDDGGTNLSGGLQAGVGQLAAAQTDASLQRVVLISDGLANEGIVDRAALTAMARETTDRGVSITTVGVGLDFDEQTMTQIAVSGRGNYYFVESSAHLAGLFGRELELLGATAATRVRVSVSPAPGVEVVEAMGYPLVREGATALVPIADMHAGETRKVVLRLRVSSHATGAMTLADIAVSYAPVGAPANALQSAAVTARTAITDDAHAVAAGRDPDAIRHIERALTARAIADATEQYEAGNAAGAQVILQARAHEAMKIADDVGDAKLGAELEEATLDVGRGFAAGVSAPGSEEDRRARKAGRFDAYKLAR